MSTVPRGGARWEEDDRRLLPSRMVLGRLQDLWRDELTESPCSEEGPCVLTLLLALGAE
jgi:hypothetical protein